MPKGSSRSYAADKQIQLGSSDFLKCQQSTSKATCKRKNDSPQHKRITRSKLPVSNPDLNCKKHLEQEMSINLGSSDSINSGIISDDCKNQPKKPKKPDSEPSEMVSELEMGTTDSDEEANMDNLTSHPNNSDNNTRPQVGESQQLNIRPKSNPPYIQEENLLSSQIAKQQIEPSPVIKTRVIQAASLNLNILGNQEDSYNSITSMRQVLINSTEDSPVNVSKINPIRVANEINKLCGEVDDIQHRRSGSLVIKTKTYEQVVKLLSLTHFTEKNIPVIVTRDWGSITVQGKIYAPEFSEDSLEDLLEMLKPEGVVRITKLFRDPKLAYSQIYVLTFLANTCPTFLKVGYVRYRIDKYYPSPIRCNKCFRWGHMTKICTSAALCSHCGKKDHKREHCTESVARCINCDSTHEATSKLCPVFKNERDICRIKVDQGISFREARNQINAISLKKRQNIHRQSNLDTNLNEQQPSSQQNSIRPKHKTISQLINSTATQHNLYNYLQDESDTTDNEQAQENNHISSSTESLIPAGQKTSKRRKILKNSNKENKSTNPLQQQAGWQLQGHWKKQQSQQQKQYNQQLQQQQEHFTQQQQEHFTQQRQQDRQQQLTDNQTRQQQHYQMDSQGKYGTEDIRGMDFKQLLLQLIPIIMKLFISDAITDKVECFKKIGLILQAEDLIANTLKSMNITSIANSQ